MLKSGSKIIAEDIVEIEKALDAKSLIAFSGANILVTGSTGLIGFYIVSTLHYLSEKYGLRVHLYCSTRDVSAAKVYFSNYIDCSGIEFVNFRQESCSAPYDFIFHTASSTNPVDLLTKPLDVIETNVYYTNDLLKLLSPKSGQFVFFSTREIYGKKVDPDQVFIEESDYGALDPVDVRSAYPESKRLAENMVASFSKQFGNPFRIVRISHTYGPGIKLNDGRVLSDIIGSMVSDLDIKLKSDGLHKISPTYVGDVVSGILVSMLCGQNGCYNISNHREIYSVFEVANMASNCSPGVEVTRQLVSDNSPLYLKHDTGILSSKKILKLGWDFKVSLQVGMQRVYEHTKNT